MQAIPRVVPGRVVDPTGRYRCPLCSVQSTGDDADTGWVRCPMMADRMICLGSCIDHQAVARAENFEDDPERDLFFSVSEISGSPVTDLRRICMEHQVAVIDLRLEEGKVDRQTLAHLRSKVIGVLSELECP